MKTTKPIMHHRLIQFLIIGWISLSFNPLFAQDQAPARDNRRHDKIKQLKIAYFTEELNLTVAESEKFWPLYNEMEEKLKNNRQANRKIVDEISQNADTYSDDDFKKNVNKIFDNETQQTAIQKEYYSKIAGVIGYKKATKMLKLEKEFKQKLLKELKERKGDQEPRRSPPNRR